MHDPPTEAIDAAISEANRLPERCVKSHRGASIFDDAGRVLARGHNAQPGGVMCSGMCRQHCGKICEHAEAMAIRLLRVQAPGRSRGLHMLHVKTVDGALVQSGLPSCWQCSRQMVADGRIEYMWLFHADGWCRYAVADFHRITLETCGLIERAETNVTREKLEDWLRANGCVRGGIPDSPARGWVLPNHGQDLVHDVDPDAYERHGYFVCWSGESIDAALEQIEQVLGVRPNIQTD